MKNKNISILVVDDEEMIVTILMNFLSEKKYNVTGLTDASEAIELIHKQTFDVVFTDLMMPGINGMELIKEIRSLDVDTQIIIFTGYASVDSAIDAVQQGVYDYIKKPFRLEDIENVLIHASEKLMLQRENIRLHHQIKNMLSQITMLYDVSSIIYQVTEKKYAVEMLFDTMSESMAIHSAMICQSTDEHEKFENCYCVQVPETLKEGFSFKVGSKLNDTKIIDSEPTIVQVFGKRVDLDGKSFELESGLDRIIFVPIQYRGNLEGYLVIFEQEGQEHPFKDELTLLKILATQIAPIISSGRPKHTGFARKRELEPSKMIMDLIQSEIHESTAADSAVSFALVRLVNLGGAGDDSEFPLIRESWRNRLAQQLGPDKRIHWAGIDTLLIHTAGGNPVGLDHHLANARFELESGTSHSESSMKLSMTYSILTYPFDADSAKMIMTLMSSKLFNANAELNMKQ